MTLKVKKGRIVGISDEPAVVLHALQLIRDDNGALESVLVERKALAKSLVKAFGSITESHGQTIYWGEDDRSILDQWVPEELADEKVVASYREWLEQDRVEPPRRRRRKAGS